MPLSWPNFINGQLQRFRKGHLSVAELESPFLELIIHRFPILNLFALYPHEIRWEFPAVFRRKVVKLDRLPGVLIFEWENFPLHYNKRLNELVVYI